MQHGHFLCGTFAGGAHRINMTCHPKSQLEDPAAAPPSLCFNVSAQPRRVAGSPPRPVLLRSTRRVATQSRPRPNSLAAAVAPTLRHAPRSSPVRGPPPRARGRPPPSATSPHPESAQRGASGLAAGSWRVPKNDCLVRSLGCPALCLLAQETVPRRGA
jgi:hypothetical protein